MADLECVREGLLQWIDVEEEQLAAPIRYYVKSPGRLFRPTLTLTSGYIVNPEAPADRLVTAAVAGELLHLATLCHDDLCDEAATRRGRPSVNAAFGDAEALVAGDYLLATSLAAFAGLGPHPLRVITTALKSICLGQLREIQDLYNRNRSERSYFDSVTGKTANLMAACARIGAFVGGAGEAEQQAIGAYARGLGVAFQIWDDVRDIWSLAGATGKATGKDIDNGVFTLPVIYGFQADRARLEELLDGGAPGGDRHALIRAFLDDHEIQRRSVRVARQHVFDGMRALDGLPGPSSGAAGPLIAVAHALMPEVGELLAVPGGPCE
ncbi:MAG TPA: polyprenyl synthetase family protein [Trebonia sp.]|nr:polyprenyl synthetase family protein [Trebonia sp.]